MSKLIGLRVLLFFRATYVVSLSLCDSSSYLEVKEGQNNTFVCTGLTPQPNVYFYWGTKLILSSCTTISCSNDQYPQYFQISRTKPTASDVTVYASTYPDLDYLATTSLSCQQGSPANRATCQLDVVYPAVDPKCQIQFSGDTWEVTGWCTVSKALSRRNKYGCYLYETSQQSSSALVANVTMSKRPIAGSVYCQINYALPPEGKYIYSVIIIPGGVEVFPTFNGSNEIRRPSVSPQHTCPQTVTEGEDVDCVCFSDHLGLPSGYVVWTRTNSPKLKIEKVNRTYDGTSNVCVLMWNNTAVQNVTYTIAVNYASRVLSFKIDNKADDIVNVRENTTVSVVCEAEGRPLPTLRLFTRSSDNQDVELTAVNNGLQLQYTMSVKCETSASYSCKSENEFSKDQRRILLTVSCAPRQTTQDIYSTAFNGGEARLEFKIIAYPPPDDLSVVYIGSSLNDTTLRKVEYKNTMKFECTSESVYMVTCTVTLLNKTIFSTGVYHAVLSNNLGNISLTFEIKDQLHTTEQSKPEVAGQVAGGVVGAVVAIVLTASIVIFIIRRKRMRNERGSRTNPVMTSKTDPQKSLETLYGQLQREDVNSPSVYQSLGHQQTSSNTTNQDEGRSHVYEVPIDLQENTRETHQKETIYQNNTLF